MTAKTIRRERLLLVEHLRALSEHQWDQPSLCAGWTIRHVLAHLVTPFSVSASAMALAVTRHRSIGRAMDFAAPLTDVVCHGADIRWALGEPVADWSDPVRLRPVLDFLTGPRARAGFLPAGRLRGVTLVATDQQWRHGQGAEVHGPSLALAMAILGREAALTVLSGEGVVLLA